MDQPTQFEREHDKAGAFEVWLASPMPQMLISLMPAPENLIQRDVLQTLLRAAYDVGHQVGASGVAMQLMEKMLEAKARKFAEQQEQAAAQSSAGGSG